MDAESMMANRRHRQFRGSFLPRVDWNRAGINVGHAELSKTEISADQKEQKK
jgi:hypothetical protein